MNDGHPATDLLTARNAALAEALSHEAIAAVRTLNRLGPILAANGITVSYAVIPRADPGADVLIGHIAGTAYS